MVPIPRRLKADLALAFVTLIWGSTFVVVKEALGDASPLVFVTFRFTFAFLLLAALFHRRLLHNSSGILPAGIVTGGFLCGGYVFQTMGLQYTTPTKSAFITAMSVVLVPLLVVALFRQRLRAPAVVGVAVAFCGLYFLTMPSGKLVAEMGDLLTLVCALGFAGHIVAVGHYAPRHDVAALAVWQVGAAAAFAILATPLAHFSGIEHAELVWTPRLILALAITAGLATALAFSLQTWAQRFTTPTHTAIIYTLEPVFAALTSYLILAERFGSRALLGAGLVFAGVLVAELRAVPEPGMPGAPASGAGQETLSKGKQGMSGSR